MAFPTRDSGRDSNTVVLGTCYYGVEEKLLELDLRILVLGMPVSTVSNFIL